MSACDEKNVLRNDERLCKMYVWHVHTVILLYFRVSQARFKILQFIVFYTAVNNYIDSLIFTITTILSR